MHYNIIESILGGKHDTFALLYRPLSHNNELVEIITGKNKVLETIGEIPITTKNIPFSNLVLIPYSQLKEKGYDYIDDRASLISIEVEQYETIPKIEIINNLPEKIINIENYHFDMPDDEYGDIVDNIIKNEIGNGEGSNFVIQRQFNADISNYTLEHAISIFTKLLKNETGSYWTFLIHTNNRTFVGASPEMHINLNQKTVSMNPISGTYRYPESGVSLTGLIDFLNTRKEADELFMVVEEELKMFSKFCKDGGTVEGPYLKEMSNLAHTEYFVRGMTQSDPRIILKESLFAPTIIGSPLQNACRVIKKYEKNGRGYYGGVAALVGMDCIDSCILIRTSDIDQNGHVKINLGATIVRHSNPKLETIETQTKAKSLLKAMNFGE